MARTEPTRYTKGSVDFGKDMSGHTRVATIAETGRVVLRETSEGDSIALEADEVFQLAATLRALVRV